MDERLEGKLLHTNYMPVRKRSLFSFEQLRYQVNLRRPRRKDSRKVGRTSRILNFFCVIWVLERKKGVLSFGAPTQWRYTLMREMEVLGNGHLNLDSADWREVFETAMAEQVRPAS
jgi:hypothetical protein